MQSFSINLLILLGIIFILFILQPDMMKQIIQVYGAIGILPAMLILIVLAALPKRRRR
jgi:hypothetical protein